MSDIEFQLDPKARSPLFRQLQDQIRYAISVGELKPGDALPSIRELEARLGINRNTVRRAYLELQIERTLDMQPGREAVVAPRSQKALSIDREQVGVISGGLVSEFLRRAEAAGIDSVQIAELVDREAREHDANYPRCAYLECSDRQALYMADHAAQLLGRQVVPINLHELQSASTALPSSIRFILTPHWHAADAESLVDAASQTVMAVRVQVSAECAAHLRSLNEARLGLVVRDSESLPGFRERLRQHVGQASIEAALADDRSAVASMMARVEHVVYTSPCADIVRTLAPKSVGTHELVFESVSEDLLAARQRMFPPLRRLLQPGHS